MPSRKARSTRSRKRGGGLKEDALATLKDHGIKTDHSGLDKFLLSIGLHKAVQKGDYTYFSHRQGIGRASEFKLIVWKTNDHPHIDLTKEKYDIPKPYEILFTSYDD
jgi:hypothetical protein